MVYKVKKWIVQIAKINLICPKDFHLWWKIAVKTLSVFDAAKRQQKTQRSWLIALCAINKLSKN